MYDLLVIGGGINGAGIARDAAGRGLKVLLVEQGDLAGATSSASSKLIHGGLRYLEHYEFRLVREGLAEREVLLRLAPHIIRPLRFVLPHDASLRPVWMIRAGLFLYDHLARRSRLPGSRLLDLRRDAAGAPLKPGYARGFAYSDCRVEDSRLVVLNALDAAERGAEIRTRCRFLRARRENGFWRAEIEAVGRSGANPSVAVEARILVNAAGPWVDRVLRDGLGLDGARHLRLVKGSHIVVPRLYDGDQAYILQNTDARVVFVIPYEGDFTLIGTTDVPFRGDPAEAAISPDEIAYLCAAVGRYFVRAVRPEDVVWSFAGVRPLHDDAESDPSAVTRDYVLEVEGMNAPVLSVFGGKITTYRRLAEQALEKLAPFVPGLPGPWTARVPLPGGDFDDFDALLAELRAAHPWLPEPLARRLARAYGTRVTRLLNGAASLDDLGADLGAGLTERELAYLVEAEWARTAEDILWRRSKLGLHDPALAGRLDAALARLRARLSPLRA